MKLQINNEEILGEGYFTRIFKRLFEDLSVDPFPLIMYKYPPLLKPFIDKVYTGGHYTFNGKGVEHVPQFDIPQSNRILIGFSGGKDSVASVLQARALGLDPVIMHFKGLNRSYPNETTATHKLAGILGVELIEVHVSYEGTTAYPDNPIKDQFILACMVDYGIKHGIHRFALGNYEADTYDEASKLYNWSDVHEQFEAVQPYFTAHIPNFINYTFLKNTTQAFKIFVDSGQTDLLNEVVSCVLPYRFRAHRKKANEIKFGIQLMANRCGSCQKCATEYAHLVGLGAIPRDDVFMKHAIKILKKNIEPVYGIKGKFTDKQTLEKWLDTDVIDINKLLP